MRLVWGFLGRSGKTVPLDLLCEEACLGGYWGVAI